MRIERIAIWTHDLERLRQFYDTHFEGRANTKSGMRLCLQLSNDYISPSQMLAPRPGVSTE